MVHLHRLTALILETLNWAIIKPFKGKPIRFRAVVEQCVRFGWDSIIIVSVISFFIGLILAMQAADSNDPAVYKDKMFDVANAPGEQIFPGELAKALQILADGGEVDLVGASAIEFIEPGEASGSYRVIETKNGIQETIGYR